MSSQISMISYTQKYLKLREEHEELKKNFEQLKKDCQENTIINSMNDMKQSYEIQEKKIINLKNYIDEMDNYIQTAKMMTSVISTNISDYTSMRSFKQELRTRLEFIIEILDINLKRKNELLYSEYNLTRDAY